MKSVINDSIWPVNFSTYFYYTKVKQEITRTGSIPITESGPQTNTPKASNLGGGSNSLGLGAAPNAAAKDATASAAKPKAESSQISIDDVMKKTQIPGNLGSKIKQADFAAGKAHSVGKR